MKINQSLDISNDRVTIHSSINSSTISYYMMSSSSSSSNSRNPSTTTYFLSSLVCILCILLLRNDAKLQALEEQIQEAIAVINSNKSNNDSTSGTSTSSGSSGSSIIINNNSSSRQKRWGRRKGAITEGRRRILRVKGAVGDGITDDTVAIQRALTKARKNRIDATVVLQKGTFLITSPLNIPAGVTLRGQGYGSSPLAIQFDAGGSVIAYCGNNYAIRIFGHSSKVENLAVYDWPYAHPGGSECTAKGKGGILIQANDRLVESISIRNVLIYWFMGGTALTLKSLNAGGIAFSSFENVRIRHAKIGVNLLASDELSFCNSNKFIGGAITGGITDAGIMASGPGACNDNQFVGTAIEPPSTDIAHVYVTGEKTNVKLDKVRLEGTEMPQDRPMIIVDESSYGNIMNGILGHTFIKADFNRNPGITFATNKMTGVQPAPANLFWNAAFHGLDVDNQLIPGWTFDGSDFTIDIVSTSEEAPRYPNHNIISIVRGSSSSSSIKFKQPVIPPSAAHSFCTFGIYAKSTTPNSIVAVMKYESGSTISSSAHTGSGDWEFIAMSALYNQDTGPLPYFSITGDVNLTAPVFSYGNGPAVPGSEFLSAAGARMSGVLAMNVVKVSAPAEGGFWTLPKGGNVFDIAPLPEITPLEGETCSSISTSYKYVSRISHSGADRFDVGAIITLLFPECGGCVPCLGISSGGYIKLVGNMGFAPPPSAPSSSLTLVSREGGVWSEVSRNTI